MNAEESLRRLVEGNDRYLTSRNEIGDISPFARTRTAVEGQHPCAGIICCSDSREIPEAIFSSGSGDLFVIRVAGNVIDSSILGSVEYACSHLGCPLVVVLGHTRCGAVDAALSGHADGYIRCIADRIADAIGDETDPLEASRLTTLGTVRSMREAIAEHAALPDSDVRGAMYDIATGAVEFLEGRSELLPELALALGLEVPSGRVHERGHLRGVRGSVGLHSGGDVHPVGVEPSDGLADVRRVEPPGQHVREARVLEERPVEGPPVAHARIQ